MILNFLISVSSPMKDLVKRIGWDLVPVVCTHISGIQDEIDSDLLDILNRIALVSQHVVLTNTGRQTYR